MDAVKIAKAIGDDSIDHILLNYAAGVRSLIEFNKDGKIKNSAYGATKVFRRILEEVNKQDPKFAKMLLEEVMPVEFFEY